MSEGRLLRELMRILGFEKKKNYTHSDKSDFLESLESMEEPYLHISAHGEFKLGKGTRIQIPHGERVFSSDLMGAMGWKTQTQNPPTCWAFCV
jgi:hypothetical protein